jgi:hypothetical protein
MSHQEGMDRTSETGSPHPAYELESEQESRRGKLSMAVAAGDDQVPHRYPICLANRG